MVYAFNVGQITADLSQNVPLKALNLPVTDGLEAFVFMSDGESNAIFDMYGNGDNLLQGNPIFSGNKATVSSTDYIETNAVETLEMTIFNVFKMPNAISAAVSGVYGGTGSIGFSMYTQSSSVGRIQANAGRVGGGGGALSLAASVDQWHAVSVKADAAGAMRLRNHTAGSATNSTADAPARAVSTTGKIRVGSFPVGPFTGPIDMALSLVYARSLSDSELAEVYAWAKDLLADYGLDI